MLPAWITLAFPRPDSFMDPVCQDPGEDDASDPPELKKDALR